MAPPVDPELHGDSNRPSASSPRRLYVGRFAVLEKLGQGAMGVVWAALDERLDRKVAIKVIRATASKRARARLEREAKAMAKLSHPNVASVYEYGQHEGDPFVAMEFVSGQALGAWFKKQKRPWQEVVQRMVQAGKGLAAAHDAGLVHRDFKPENVMIGDGGRVRVLDFGLVGVSQSVALKGFTGRSAEEFGAVTAEGSTIGTPAYMAPEQFQGDEVDRATDQFGYCVAFYEGLYGMRPFAGENWQALGLNVVRGQVLDRPADSDVPLALHKVVLRGLSVAPAERYETMNDLLAAVHAATASTSGGGRMFVGIAAMVGLAAAGLGGWLVLRQEPSSACDDRADPLAEAWDAEAQQGVIASLAAAATSAGVQPPQHTGDTLEGYANAWRDAELSACRDDELAKYSPKRTAQRNACLDDRKLALAAAVDALGSDNSERALEAAYHLHQLQSVAECDDAEQLERWPSEATSQHMALREQTARLQWSFESEPALRERKAAELVKAAAAAKDDVALANALVIQSESRIADERHAEAAESLGKARNLAQRTGQDRLAARAAYLGAFVAAKDPARSEAAADWLAFGDAAGRQASEASPLARYEAHQARGRALDAMGRVPEALDAFAQAEAALGDEPGTELARVELLLHHGQCHIHDINGDQALAALDRAQELLERTLGTAHPRLAHLLTMKVAAAGQAGHYVQAKDYARRSNDILLARNNDLMQAAVLTNLRRVGALHYWLGEYEQSAQLSQSAVDDISAKLGPDNEELISPTSNLALALARLGNHDEYETHFARALELLDTHRGANDPERAEHLRLHGVLHVELGNPERGEKLLATALEIRETLPDEVRRGEVRAGYALALAGLGRMDDARREATTARTELQSARSARHRDALAALEAWLRDNP